LNDIGIGLLGTDFNQAAIGAIHRITILMSTCSCQQPTAARVWVGGG